LDRYGLTPEKLQKILTQVNQALINHQQWYAELIRSITCKLPANECDIGHEPHKKCNFGKWYYSNDNLIPVSHPSFSAIELKHKIMHEMAAKLLIESQAQSSISVMNYDDFATANEALQIELNGFKHEFENMLYERDSLTGATTRMSILPTLKEQQELILRGIQSDCCIAMMDLDHFKSINDNFGHLVGDHVLSTVIQYLIEQLRPYDKVFRYGGEEFIILMQYTDLTTAYDLIERLRKGIESLPIKIDDNVFVKITASFGVVKLDPDLLVENSIEFADKAMYKAKAAGRNRVNIGDDKRYA
jgi:diguanylate cyclase (GGDEF)-like protein